MAPKVIVAEEAFPYCFRPLSAQEAAPVLRPVTRAKQHSPRRLVVRPPRRNQRRRSFVLIEAFYFVPYWSYNNTKAIYNTKCVSVEATYVRAG